MTDFEKARALLHEFKGSSYLFGAKVLTRVGDQVAAAGKKAALVRDTFKGSDDYVAAIRDSLAESGVDIAAEITKSSGSRQQTISMLHGLIIINPPWWDQSLIAALLDTLLSYRI